MLLLFQKIHQELEQKKKEGRRATERGCQRERPERRRQTQGSADAAPSQRKTGVRERPPGQAAAPGERGLLTQLRGRPDPQNPRGAQQTVPRTDARWRHQPNIAWLPAESAGQGQRGSRLRLVPAGCSEAARPSESSRAGASLVVSWLQLGAPNAEGTGSIPGQGTKIPHAKKVKIIKKA